MSEAEVVYASLPEFPGYRIGNDGTVWSCKNARWGFRDTWKILKPCLLDGYPSVAIMDLHKKRRTKFVHALVLSAFRGQRPLDMDACHDNGNRADARLCNLRWDTRLANCKDTMQHGRTLRGEKARHAVLTEKDVVAIREMHRGGQGGYKTLAKEFGCAWQTVAAVVRRENWKHVP